MDKFQRNLHTTQVREDGITVESHALWNFGRRPRLGYANHEIENLHVWRSHYLIERVGIHAPTPPMGVGFRGFIQRHTKRSVKSDHPMALPNEVLLERGNGTDQRERARPRLHPSWLHSDGDFDPRHMSWACPDRDLETVWGDLLRFARTSVDTLKGCFRP